MAKKCLCTTPVGADADLRVWEEGVWAKCQCGAWRFICERSMWIGAIQPSSRLDR